MLAFTPIGVHQTIPVGGQYAQNRQLSNCLSLHGCNPKGKISTIVNPNHVLPKARFKMEAEINEY
jgi:hypothetical protein